MKYYKIIEYKNNKIKTLFHGINNSKVLYFSKWLKADKKIVIDGNNGTEYLSGWHLFNNYIECKEYLKFFKDISTKVIVECKAKNIRKKEHSRNNVFLSDEIFIEKIIEII